MPNAEDDIIANAIAKNSKPNPEPKMQPGKLDYPFDESAEPTGPRNFQARLISGPQSYYPNLVVHCFPDNNKEAITDLAKRSDAIQAIVDGAVSSHNTFGARYQAFAQQVEKRTKEIAHSKLLDKVAHREDVASAQKLVGLHISDRQGALYALQQIQAKELATLKALFTNDQGKFVAFSDANGVELVSAENVQKMYEKAEYELKVSQTHQHATLANRFNNDLKQVKDLWLKAEENAAAMLMQSIVEHGKGRPDFQKSTDFHSRTDQPMEGFEFHTAREYRAMMRKNAKTDSGYNIQLGRDALKKFGAKINKDTALVINIKATKDGKYVAKPFLNANWTSSQQLAALKAFVMESKAQGLKNFRGISSLDGLKPKHKIELIAYIRQVYGREAKISDEGAIINQKYIETHFPLSWKNPLKYPSSLKNVMGPLSTLNDLTTPKGQEKLHNAYLAKDNVNCFSRGKIGTEKLPNLPSDMEVPKAENITRPENAPPISPTGLEGKPISKVKNPPPPNKSLTTSAALKMGQKSKNPQAGLVSSADDNENGASRPKIY